MERELSELLPIYGVEDGCILSKQGAFTLAFRVHKPEIFTLSAEQYEALHQCFVKAIRVLPLYSVIHLMDWFLTDRYEASFDGDKSFLGQSSERFFNERPWMRHESYCFLTKKPAGRQESTSAFSSLFRRSIMPEESMDVEGVAAFKDVTSAFRRILEDTGLIRLELLRAEDLWSGSGKAGLIERYCTLAREGRPALGDIDWQDGMRIGNRHCALYTLCDGEDLPATCSSRTDYLPYSTDRSKYPIGFACGLGLLLNVDHVYNQLVFVDDAHEAIRKLEAKRLRLQSLASYSRENAVSEQGVNGFLNEAVSEQRLPVLAHFNILGWGDRARLSELRNDIASAIAGLDGSPREEVLGAPQIWWGCLPGNEGDFPMNETFRTFAEQAACLFEMETNYGTSLSPYGLRLGDRITGRPVYVDIDDEPRRLGWAGNSNSLVISGSGGGKSFAMAHMTDGYLEQGAHVLLIDIGGSYEILCKLKGGTYFTYSEETPICFNPFFIPPGDVFDIEKRESIKTLLLALWKKTEEGHNRSEYVALSNALQGYFGLLDRRPDVFPCFDSFYEYLRQDFSEVLKTDNVKEKDFDLGNFLYVLRPFYKGGEYDYLLNARENLDLLNEQFVVFELDNIKGHSILLTVVCLIICELFVSKMRKLKGIRKVIVIEEAWKAIAQQGMAEYIKYLFKTVRKFFGKAIVVTQEIEDIVNSEIIKNAIVNNSDIKILLDQSKFANKFDDIQALLGITDKQKAEILSLNKGHEPGSLYKDLWIGIGAVHSKVYRLEVSLEQYFVYSSEQRDKMLVTQYIERYGDVKTAIARLAADQRAKREGRL